MLKPWSPMWWYLEAGPLADNWVIRWSLHHEIILGWPKSSSSFLHNIVWKTQTNFLANPIQTDSREIISVFTTWGGRWPFCKPGKLLGNIYKSWTYSSPMAQSCTSGPRTSWKCRHEFTKFWHQGPVSWKTVFPETEGGG